MESKKSSTNSEKMDRKIGNDIGHLPAKRRETQTEKLIAKYTGELSTFALGDLRRSGLTDETIAEMRVFTGSGNKTEMLKEILGFASLEAQSLPQITDLYCLPYIQSDGYCRVKLENPVNGAKYLSPVKAHYHLWHIYFLQQEIGKFNKPNLPLILTEGEKKAARLTQEIRAKQLDALALGFAGVSLWEHCVEWKRVALPGRVAYIAFDSDFAGKRPVQLEIAKFALWLYSRKATPKLLTWQEGKGKGIDDFLVGGGYLAAILAQAQQSDLGKLLAAMTLLTIADVAHYCAQYHFTKAGFKAMFEAGQLQAIYKVKKSTATELFTREVKIQAEKGSADETDHRPVIRIQGGKLPENVTDAENLLLAQEQSGIYQRSGALVRIVNTSKTNRIKCQKDTILIAPIESTYLREIFTKLAVWQLYNPQKDQSEVINCPRDIADTYLARGQWQVPYLLRIVTAPTLRADGSILDQPGYDSQTGLFFYGTETFPDIYPEAGLDEALAALAVFRELLKEFPFVGDASFSVALAAILTALIRPSLRTAPLFGFTAPQMSAGKSLLASVVALIATGKTCATFNQEPSPEEEKKQLVATLQEGHQVVCIDNIDQPLGSAALCTILSEEEWGHRLLQLNKNILLDTKTTFLATGNNLELKGDITTRALICKLDPGTDHPEYRKCAVDLKTYIPEHRGALVKAALTILRAYHNAGRPDQKVNEFGRFEQWSAWVRASLIWLGLPDPCLSRQLIEGRDPVRNNLRPFLATWFAEFNCREMTLNAAINRSIAMKNQGEDGLWEAMYAIAGEKQEINVRRLGKFLRNHDGRVECVMAAGLDNETCQTNYCCKNIGKDHQEKVLWKVEKKEIE